jgi:hypothetical protein
VGGRVGILPAQKVFPADVMLAPRPRRATGRPPGQASGALGPERRGREALRRHAAPGLPPALLAARHQGAAGGALRGRAGARVADGPVAARAQHLPGDEGWLVCEARATGERKYHLANHPPDAPLRVLAAVLKARWVCEQVHQQMKGELGLDHVAGRSWRGLHHHALLCQIAFAFLQHLWLGGKTRRPSQHSKDHPPRPRCPRCGGACSPRCSPTSRDVPDAATDCRTARCYEGGTRCYEGGRVVLVA